MPNVRGVLDDHDIDLLRRGAALVHAVPGATLRVRVGDTVILAAAHALADDDGTATLCTPCGFRSAVGAARRQHASGRRLALLGMDGSTRPVVELDPGPSGDVIDGDLVVSRIADRVVGIVATTLSPAAAADALEAGEIDATPLGAHHDELLGTTLLHVHVPIEDDDAAAEVLGVLGRARDLFSVAELLAPLQPASVQ